MNKQESKTEEWNGRDKDLKIGESNVAEHSNETEVSEDLFVIPNDGMGDHRTNHGNDQ